MKKKESLTIANTFIEASYKMHAREKKFLSTIVSEVQRTNKTERAHIMSAKTLCELANINTDDLYRNGLEIMQNLKKIQVTVKNDKDEQWEIFDFIGDCSYNKGTIEFELSKKFSEAIQGQKRNFTEIFLENVQPLKSIYSIRLYELLIQKDLLGRERKIKIKELKRILQTPDYRWSDLDRCILLKSKEEINKKTNIEMDYAPIRKGRSMYEINFWFTKKDNEMIDQELPNIPKEEEWFKKLQKEFIENKIMFKIVAQFRIESGASWEHIRDWWNYIKENIKQFPIKKRGKEFTKTLNTADKSGRDFANFIVMN